MTPNPATLQHIREALEHSMRPTTEAEISEAEQSLADYAEADRQRVRAQGELQLESAA